MADPVLTFATFFGLCAASGLLMPIPEDVFILGVGWAIHEGEVSLGAGFSAVFLGTFARDAIAFLVGRFAGERLWRLAGRLFGVARLDRARARFDGAATRTTFLTRFAIGMRAPLYVAGGTTSLPFVRFVLLDLAGLCLTTPLLLWIGADQGPSAKAWLEGALLHQRAVLLAFTAIALAAWLLRRRRLAASES